MSETLHIPFEDFEIWDIWKGYKKEQHKFTYKSTKTEQAALMHLNDISKGDKETAKAIILYSMNNGWKGLFPLKENNYGSRKTGSAITDNDLIRLAEEMGD